MKITENVTLLLDACLKNSSAQEDYVFNKGH